MVWPMSLATASPTQVTRPDSAASDRPEPVTARQTPPILLWATAGAALLLFEVFVWGKWILGPNFHTVQSGPSVPPLWMRISLDFWQVGGLVAVAVLFYRFLVRPWRARRTVTFDGLLLLSFLFVSWQDPLSSYFQNWFTYNSYMVNFGTWATDVPGWISYGKPGAVAAEPLLFSIPAYIYYLFFLAVAGSAIMRRVRDRWPKSGTFGQLGACFGALALFSVVVEGLVWFPLGVLTYPGGVGPALFSNTYHKFPLHEAVFIGLIGTAFSLMRLHLNDRGESKSERGLDTLTTGARATVLVRFLSVFAMTSAAFFFLYNVPTGIIVSHSTSWPTDLQKRSYFTDYICGDGTDRACPTPYSPLTRPGSVYIGPDGKLVVPSGSTAPVTVPFEK